MNKSVYHTLRKKYLVEIQKFSDQADLELEIITCFVLGVSRVTFFSLTNQERENLIIKNQDKLEYYLGKRIRRVPLYQIIGRKSFTDIELEVNDQVLTPRGDTEMLVELAVKIINKTIEQDNPTNFKILDLGTGSGAIAIAIAHYLKTFPEFNYKIIASDISKEALEIAKKNSSRNNIKKDNIKFIQSNLFENLNTKFNLIITNPPYLPEKELEHNQLELKYEPKIALFSGNDGLNFYRLFFDQVRNFINLNSQINPHILGEFHPPQQKTLNEIIKNSSKKHSLDQKEKLDFYPDLNQEIRFFNLRVIL